MHELSIADAIVRDRRAARGRAADRDASRCKVGHLRQVVPDALEFAWSLVAEGTAPRARSW